MMSHLFDLSGKVAVVTGSTKGIGRAIAAAFADHGAKVVVSSRDKERVADAARELAEGGREVLGIPCNVGRNAEMQNLVDQTRQAWGQIDIAVGNAAINPHYGPSTEIPDDVFAKMMATNIQSNLWLAQMVAGEMRARQDGAIIFTSSIGGLRGSGVIGTYGITKAADIQLARNLAIELGPDNIRVNCIAPGTVKTDMARVLWEDPQVHARAVERYPIGRLGESEDVAGAAVFLAARAGQWVTGQVINVDGGCTIAGSG